jgi:hypothetical protein
MLIRNEEGFPVRVLISEAICEIEIYFIVG